MIHSQMATIEIRNLVKNTKQIDPKKLGRDSFVYVDISSVDKDTKRIVEPQTLLVGDAPSRARKEIKADDVLVATVRPNLNGVAIVPSQYDNQIASTGFCVLRSDTEQLDPNYLFYFTQTKYFVSHLTDLSTGAGYPAVSDEDILDTQIPLPPLTEQKRIASLLARADRLRQLRRTAHDLGDALLQSVFLEMFGNPETNPKGWDADNFEKTILSTQNGFGQREDFSPNGTIVLRIRDISSGKVDLSDPRRMIIPEKELAKYALESKDLIIVRVNGNPNYVGIASEFTAQNEPVVFSDHVIRIRMNKEVLNTTFVVYLLNSPYGRKQTLGNVSTTAGQFTINSSGISRIKMIHPPLSLQEEFAGVVARVESLRGRMGESTRQASC